MTEREKPSLLGVYVEDHVGSQWDSKRVHRNVTPVRTPYPPHLTPTGSTPGVRVALLSRPNTNNVIVVFVVPETSLRDESSTNETLQPGQRIGETRVTRDLSLTLRHPFLSLTMVGHRRYETDVPAEEYCAQSPVSGLEGDWRTEFVGFVSPTFLRDHFLSPTPHLLFSSSTSGRDRRGGRALKGGTEEEAVREVKRISRGPGGVNGCVSLR